MFSLSYAAACRRHAFAIRLRRALIFSCRFRCRCHTPYAVIAVGRRHAFTLCRACFRQLIRQFSLLARSPRHFRRYDTFRH